MKIKGYFLISIIVLIIILHCFKWPLISRIFYPFQFLISHFDKKINQFFILFSSKKNLIEENERLKKEMTNLIFENIKLKIIEEENEKLRKELNFIKKENYQSVLVNVIGKKEEGGIDWFILDKGEDSGIKKDFVVVKEGVVVGKIIKTTKNFSYFLPLFDERVKLAAIIIPSRDEIGKDKIEGVVKGKHGLSIELDLVPSDKRIEEGDFVLTSGLEYNIPKGLFIGRVREVENKPSEIFQRALVETPLRLENLDIVNVIIPKIKEEF
ncbi:MAG: rod shape-determining protein MreC [Patescibacteria group bacterium]